PGSVLGQGAHGGADDAGHAQISGAAQGQAGGIVRADPAGDNQETRVGVDPGATVEGDGATIRVYADNVAESARTGNTGPIQSERFVGDHSGAAKDAVAEIQRRAAEHCGSSGGASERLGVL